MEQPAFTETLDKFNWELVYKNSEDYTQYAKQLNAIAKDIVDQLGLREK
jgi:tripartite-type tricarboxylate transporter receptor subunit TctC